MKIFFVLICFFVTIFNLKIAIPPYSLLFFTGVLGFCFFLLIAFLNNFQINSLQNNFLILTIVSVCLIFNSMLFNQVIDVYYLKEVVFFGLITFFSSYACLYIIRDKINNDLFLIKIVVSLVVFQLIVSFICYLNPLLFDIIFSFFSRPDLDDRILGFNETRLVGLGASFFGSGIINCFTLILIAAVLRRKQTTFDMLFFSFSFIIILVIGLMSSRSTIVGAIISIFLMFSNVSFIVRLIKILFFLGPILILTMIFAPQNDRLNDIVSFGFDFLFNFKDSQASESTGELKEMWGLSPQHLKTWLIGDVYFRTSDNGYYMNTDVGYYRIVYATGILGLLVFLITNIYLILKINNKYFGNLEKISLIFLLLVLNLKGVTNLIPLLSIFYLATAFNKK